VTTMQPSSLARPLRLAVIVLLLAGSSAFGGDGPFASFKLPPTWEARFWDDPDTKALLKLPLTELANLVPVQAGLKFCRCPACDTDETEDPLFWSATKPKVVTCRRCGQSFPNDKIPAPDKDKKIPEEDVEVLPGKIHHYPYHAVPADAQRYPDERLYLGAKLDYEKREALAKAALYAAVRHNQNAEAGKKDDLARFAAVIILRFAQVYPAYATHFDQPGQPKFLQSADLRPPFRRGYRTGKWDWTASLNLPINLVTAYALIRHEPVWDEVALALAEPNPKRTIEHGFFRASAEFSRRQPEEFDEMSLPVYRGLFAVARLLDDDLLLTDAKRRLALFSERGFFHDGYWRQGSAAAHRRVLQHLDGWIDRLADDTPEAAGTTTQRSSVPMLDLVRQAGRVPLAEAKPDEIQLASWPAPTPGAAVRRPELLGGVGMARLSVGGEKDGLDLELRGMGNLDSPYSQRQALRLAVAGHTVLDDLDALPPTRNGWDLATASHNTVVVDGLNQRETPAAARTSSPGGQFLYFAADPDFQVVALDDPRAYPRSTTRYRQFLILASGRQARYGVSVFQVYGGLQHDQLFHGPTGSNARWVASTPMVPGPETLLPPKIPYLATSSADDGRWFVQGFGEFRRLTSGNATSPIHATLRAEGRPGVRLHVLGDMPMAVLAGLSPDPTLDKPPATAAESEEGRASLILRRRSADGSTINSTFVTVFDPQGACPPLRRAGRLATTADAVVLHLDTADGVDFLVINLRPGTPQTVHMSDGRPLTTDGLAVRIGPAGFQLAGGTFARLGEFELRQDRLHGRVLEVARMAGPKSRGWFEVEGYPEQFAGIEGRSLFIRHGDGTSHGWTIEGAAGVAKRRVRLHVREEPGFLIDPATTEARYYQFPRTASVGPHEYSISRMSRLNVEQR
jgi:hypothetical protein